VHHRRLLHRSAFFVGEGSEMAVWHHTLRPPGAADNGFDGRFLEGVANPETKQQYLSELEIDGHRLRPSGGEWTGRA
jgi:hypothetical protein